MTTHAIVLTLIGEDRPGLVQALSDCVAAHNGNWQESRMAHLGGQFAGLLRVTVPEDRRQALEAALGSLTAEGLTVQSREAQTGQTDQRQRWHLDVTSHDREGIVRDVSRVLSGLRVNVEELATSCESAPMSGETMFRATAVLSLPAHTSEQALKSALEALSSELIVDLQSAKS